VERGIRDPGKIFPTAEGARARPERRDEILADPALLDDWTNYQTAEDEPEITRELLEALVSRGRAKAYPTIEAACAALGVPGVAVSRLGLISKSKPRGSTKHRLVWDLRRSLVNTVAHQGQRIVLARLSDAVADTLSLLSEAIPTDLVLMCVFDIEDAFHSLTLAACERKYQVACAAGQVFVFSALIFGGSAGPTLRGRVAA